MLDEHQIPNSGNFGISNVTRRHPQCIYNKSGLTTVLVFVDEDEEDVIDALWT
jgi:hypothetical protein